MQEKSEPFPHHQVIFVSEVLEDNEEFEKLKCVFRYASSENNSQVSTHRFVWEQVTVNGFLFTLK